MRLFIIYITAIALIASPFISGSDFVVSDNNQAHAMQTAQINMHEPSSMANMDHQCCDDENSDTFESPCKGQCGDCDKSAAALLNTQVRIAAVAPLKHLNFHTQLPTPPNQTLLIPPIA